jgi:hypothetical protein
VDAPCLQGLDSERASDRLRSYIRPVVAVAHDRGQDGLRNARAKHASDLESHWVPRLVSRFEIDRSHQLFSHKQASGLPGRGNDCSFRASEEVCEEATRLTGLGRLGLVRPILLFVPPAEPILPSRPTPAFGRRAQGLSCSLPRRRPGEGRDDVGGGDARRPHPRSRYLTKSSGKCSSSREEAMRRQLIP